MSVSQNKLILPAKHSNKINVSIPLIILCLFFMSGLFAQKTEDITDRRFHDDLLNQLVGTWNVSGVVHGLRLEKMELNAEWVMNHQYLRIMKKAQTLFHG